MWIFNFPSGSAPQTPMLFKGVLQIIFIILDVWWDCLLFCGFLSILSPFLKKQCISCFLKIAKIQFIIKLSDNTEIYTSLYTKWKVPTVTAAGDDWLSQMCSQISPPPYFECASTVCKVPKFEWNNKPMKWVDTRSPGAPTRRWWIQVYFFIPVSIQCIIPPTWFIVSTLRCP